MLIYKKKVTHTYKENPIHRYPTLFLAFITHQLQNRFLFPKDSPLPRDYRARFSPLKIFFSQKPRNLFALHVDREFRDEPRKRATSLANALR